MLFSGDALYDGPLLDELDGCDIPAYVDTMKRLRELPVTVVHGGHEPSFGRERLVELCDAYLANRGREVVVAAVKVASTEWGAVATVVAMMTMVTARVRATAKDRSGRAATLVRAELPR